MTIILEYKEKTKCMLKKDRIPDSEAFLEPCKTSKMELFVKIIKS